MVKSDAPLGEQIQSAIELVMKARLMAGDATADRGSFITLVDNLRLLLGRIEEAIGPDPRRPLENLGTRLGVMLQTKNDAYGSAFLKCDEFLALLWPDGVPRESFGTMLILVRMFDKMMRIATAPGAFNEDAESDLAGYAMLLVYSSIVKAKRTTP